MTDKQMLDRIFTEARTHRKFTDRPVSDDLLKELYELAKLAPTASNLCPMRLTFVRSGEEKKKVIKAAAEGNRPKIDSASVVVIVARDRNFQHIEILAPQMNADAFRQQDADQLEQTSIQNGWLQAGFLIAAARALGLDCGPMIGFKKEAIDILLEQRKPDLKRSIKPSMPTPTGVRVFFLIWVMEIRLRSTLGEQGCHLIKPVPLCNGTG